jgi:branched-chain amino acid transport system substrate-binding protein
MGKKIQLIVGDDACDAQQAVSVANQTVSKKAVFVAGHYCSSTSIPASAVYNEAGILQMTPASTNPKLTDDAVQKGWNNVFRTCGRDDAQGLVAGKYLADKYKGKKVAVIHDKTAYGKGLADETKKAMNAAGLKEVMYEAINKGDKDFSALISKMKQAGVDVMYLGGYQTEAGLLVRQARDQGFNATLISGDALASDEFWKITGNAGAGTLMTFAPDPRKNPAAKDLVEKFRAAGFEPEAYTLYSYAALQVVAAAANKAATNDAQKVAETIKAGGPWSTVLGEIGYDDKGDITRPDYVIYEWKKGEDGRPTYFQK